MPPAPTGRGPAKPAAASPYAGRTIARCKVGERLGRGATSQVFRAFYEPLGRDIALKILAKEAAGLTEMRKRFLSEARAVAKLSHENIVKVLDVVEDGGFLCILMELVAGQTLQDRLDDEGVIPPRHAFRIAAQVARALEAAHEQKVVHRDVKPANVMLSGKPGDEAVKVVDFGLAAQHEANRVGTPLFMSPEAAQGKRIDEKSDVYALGVCLYRMLTGVLPFTGDTVKDILAAQVNAELVPPSERRQQLGRTYDDLLKKMMVKSKGYRPAAAEIADTLEDIADDLEEREEGVRRVRRKRKRGRPRSAAKANPALWGGLAVAATVVVGFALFRGSDKDKPQRTVEPVAAPPVAADPAQKAFEEADQWVAANPGKFAESVRRWASVEKRFPGTASATQAGVRRANAEVAEQAKQEMDDRIAKERAAAAEAAKDPKVKLEKLNAAVRAFAFGDASVLLDDMDPPEGTSDGEWERKGNRLDFLARHFTDRMDAGLRALRAPLKANQLFTGAKATETIVGVNSGGAVVLDGDRKYTVPWSKASLESFFKMRVIPDRVLDTAEYEPSVVLAALAAELNQLDAMRKFLKIARGHSDPDELHAGQLKSLFGN